MRRLLVAALLALVLAPATANAAAPVATGAMDVQLWPGGQPEQTVVIVSVVLPKAVKLPVTVRLPVPDGAKLDWVGEITGTDPSQDPTRTYEVKRGPSGRYVEFEVSKGRQAQLEASGLPLAIDGTKYTGKLRWVQSAPASVTAFSVQLPSGTEMVSIEPKPHGKPSTNISGETLYVLATKSLKTGDTVDMKATYRTAELPDVASGPDTSSIVLYVLLGALLLAVAVFVALMGRRRQE